MFVNTIGLGNYRVDRRFSNREIYQTHKLFEAVFAPKCQLLLLLKDNGKHKSPTISKLVTWSLRRGDNAGGPSAQTAIRNWSSGS